MLSGATAYLSKNGTLTFPAVFFFNDTATTEIYTLSLHDALPIFFTVNLSNAPNATITKGTGTGTIQNDDAKPLLSIDDRSEDHTYGRQSQSNLAFRLILATAVPVSVDFATAYGTAIGNTSCTGSA